MTLRDYGMKINGELEVWDADVDIANPYYLYDGEMTWKDNEDEHYLYLLEDWLLGLNIDESSLVMDATYGFSCCVTCYHELDLLWERMMCRNKELNLFAFDSDDEDDMKADLTEDLFTCLSQGYYGLAKRFCLLLELD